MTRPGDIPEATVARLPLYLRILVAAAERGEDTIASEGLAGASGVSSANVRKDLSHLVTTGVRGVGYHVDDLVREISTVLGLGRRRSVAIVGIGNLGRALASYRGFQQRGFTVAALLDVDEAVIGRDVDGRVVEPFAEAPTIVAQRDITVGVLTVPAPRAQDAATTLVDAGVTGILNFAPTYLQLPPHVTVRRVDLSTELQILSFYDQLASGLDQQEGVVAGG